ncbi:FxDxF family PEP-CTERM protein [Herbaspirillum sp.]|uniref:FxDxF family PEP-CTERM protein n=1 Tax=Herbaspirillum sp. TaxID=1890675 RepID=UPI0031DAC0B1
MNKLASSLILATSLAASASLANAAQIEKQSHINLNGGTSDLGASFSAKDSGKTFLENFTFKYSGLFALSAATISTALGSDSALDLTNFTLSGNGHSYTGTKSTVGNTQYYTLDLSNLTAGKYTLAVAGTVLGSRGGSFGGNISVSAVPEASTLAMMLGGLAVVGFGAWRRRKSDKASPSNGSGLMPA